MKNFSLKIFLLLIMAIVIAMPLTAQECKENYETAENCLKKGQYKKAMQLFVKSRDCGDAFYQKKSAAQISNLREMMREKEAVKSAPKSKGSEKQYIIVPSLIYLPSGTEEKTVTVESSGQWGARGKSDLIRVAKKNAKTLTVSSVSENASTRPRRTSVTVECGEISRVITVEQDGVPETLEYKSKYMNIPYEGGKFIVELETNTKWFVDDSDWYKASQLDDDSTRMVIHVDKNYRNEDRYGTIRVRTESGMSDELEIYQYANESKIFAAVDSIIQIPAQGDTIYVKIISDNATWTESDRPSFCSAQKLTPDSLMIIVARNKNYCLREGFVNIKSNDRVAGIRIRQDASELPDFMSKKILGGRGISFGLTAGYVVPFVKSTSSGTYTGSVINYSLGDKSEDVNYSSQTGFSFGAVLDLRVDKNWYIKTGVDYTHLQYTNSFKADVDRSVAQGFNMVYQGTFQNAFKEKYKFDFISIPVLVSYRFVFDKKNNLQVDLGPVVDFAVSGKMSFEGNSNSDNVYPHSVIYGETGPVIGNRSSEYMRYTGKMNLFDKKVTNTTTSSVGGMSKDYLNEYTAPAAPYKRVNLGLRVGVTYEYAGLQLGLTYTHMLTNMANKSFWNSGRLPIFGQTSDVLMAGYKHRINMLEMKVGYILRYKK